MNFGGGQMVHRKMPGAIGENLVRLVKEEPLAWLTSPSPAHSTLLPMIPVFGDGGDLVAIEGHMARSNPHINAIESEKNGVILYKGPDAYIPTAWLANKSLAPTWMFASATFHVNIQLMPDAEDTKAHLSRLVACMEKRNGTAWKIEQMGDRFEMLSNLVIGFRAEILRTEERFKLGQNEDLAVLEEMIEGLEETGQEALAVWVKQANSQALNSP
ncbi:FMN-binding negative transcriptional regulator [Parasphingorhabdus sp.]|uniref:FMN-binding negative transcriptional regulator n=1 Tax=Parasphingorhabdus sp. TaxID=2709688 RepID=UPI003265D298